MATPSILSLARYLALALAIALVPVSSSVAKEQAAEQEEGAQELKTLDLGRFDLREVRFTSNETVKMNFAVVLRLKEDASEEEMARLEEWKHRLRDQVITAVRTAEIPDFHEPDLVRLRKIILYRLHRVMQEERFTEVLLGQFRISVE